MALIFSDGFDSYSSTSDMLNRWSSNTGTSFNATGGRWGGGAFSGTFSAYLVKSLPTALVVGNTIATGFWIMSGAGSQSGNLQFDTSGGGGTTGNQFFSTNTAGRPIINQLGSSSTALLTATASICDGQWHWVELFINLQTTATGSCQMWIDGISQGSATGVQTINSNFLPVTALRFGNGSSSATFIDDVHIWDYTGSFFNSSPMGPLRVKTLVPTGDSSPLQFTPDTGTTHYTQVTGGYNNTHYVQDGGTGNVDLYTYGTLGYTPTSVYAVVANYWAQNPGSGTPSLIPQLKTGATTVQGTTGTLPTGGVNKLITQVWYQDATNTNWTTSTANALIVGVGD